jgi:hypothetical protein
MADHWFRLYDKIVHDINVQALPGPLFKSWINILCIVSDNGGCLPGLNAVAFALRVDEATALVAVNALRKAGLLEAREDGAFVPHNWNGRQFVTDTKDGSRTPGAVKAKKHREKVKAEKLAAQQVTSPVTSPVIPQPVGL